MTQHDLAFKAAGILILAFEKRGDINGTFDPAWMCGPIEDAIAAAVAEAVKAEREECANVCNSPEIFRESYQLDANTGKGYNLAMRDIAAAIRARGGK